MTIVDAIKAVLEDKTDGLTTKEIYNEIIKEELYVFGAKNPIGVINSQIRRRCIGLDFPTAYPTKLFRISGHRGKKIIFALYDENFATEDSKKTTSKDAVDALPEERIEAALQEHRSMIKQQVLDCVLENTPDFFEHLVLDLLLKMGYGYGKQTGKVTGGSHDGGIDGKISEDKLGLDLIYFQAKRYSTPNKVGRKELQAFIGAMEHIHKGVFITTSEFTEEAKAFIEKQQQKSIKLINGEMLADFLVKYEVGIIPAQNISIYKIDLDYFNG